MFCRVIKETKDSLFSRMGKECILLFTFHKELCRIVFNIFISLWIKAMCINLKFITQLYFLVTKYLENLSDSVYEKESDFNMHWPVLAILRYECVCIFLGGVVRVYVKEINKTIISTRPGGLFRTTHILVFTTITVPV